LEFRKESFALFEELLENIRAEATRFLARVEIEVDAPEELERIQKLGRKKTVEHQNTESAFSSDEPEKKSQPQSPQSQEQGNRRLRRYEAKMARKNANKK
jgi:preprotein translocase subunit SecA